jgi:D-alanyl-D-alanine carboxypeptidase (penicillin-binding protein 5/6)
MRRCRLIAAPLAAALAALGSVAPASAQQAASGTPSVGAPSAIVIDASNGEVLFGRRERDRRAIASTTKLMTAQIALTKTSPQEVFAMPPYPISPAESQIGLRTGERMTVHDLMRAMMLPSANDAAYDLAVNIAGSKAAFVRMMNAQARRLGLTGTHYSTPVGLDDPRNYSTAYDLAKLAAYDLRNKTFARIVNLPSARLSSGAHRRIVVNRNTLVRRYGFVDGVKTGHTVRAGYVLVGAARQNGAQVISVVLGTPSESARDADSLSLLRWGVAQFRRSLPVVAHRAYARANVKWHDGEKVDLVAARSFAFTARRGERVTRRVQAPDELSGPLARGTRVGTVQVVYRGKVVQSVPLVTASSVQGAGFLRKAAGSLGGPLPTIALIAFLGAAATLALRVRSTRTMRGEKAAR